MSRFTFSPTEVPMGFRFSPTDPEVIHYLRSKISGNDKEVDFIPEISFNKWEPWDLPGKSSIPTVDREWFFFAQPQLKHRRGNRSERLTEKGFWKPTGNDRKIMSGSRLIGMKKTLVFYEGRARKCTKTSWVTHEYRTDPYQINSFLVCRLFDKREGPNGAGPFVQSPLTSQSHLDESNSEIALGSVSPSSEVQVPDFGTRAINEVQVPDFDTAISDTTTAVENQSAQDTFAEDEQLSLSEEDFEMLEACLHGSVDTNLSTALPNSLAVLTPTIAKSSLEEGKSEIVVASVSPALGEGTYNIIPCQNGNNTATDQLAVVTATELKDVMNLEKVSAAFPAVSPVTNDLNSSHGGVGLQNGMNENAAYSLEDFISLADLDDNFLNEFGGQKDLASGIATPMNVVVSNAEHDWVPLQYLANDLAAYSSDCCESVFHNPYNVLPPIEPLGGSSNQILRSD